MPRSKLANSTLGIIHASSQTPATPTKGFIPHEESVYRYTLQVFGLKQRTDNAVEQLKRALQLATTSHRIELRKGYYEAIP